MWALFGKNVCENKRIGSRREGVYPACPPIDPPMEAFTFLSKAVYNSTPSRELTQPWSDPSPLGDGNRFYLHPHAILPTFTGTICHHGRVRL